MNDLIQYSISGIALGSIYALVALGFVVIYRASSVFNFAHGELLTLGAFLAVALSAPPAETSSMTLGGPAVSGLGLPFVLAVILALGATGLIGAGVERVILRPLIGRPVFVSIIITLFVSILLRTIVVLAFGTEPLPLTPPWDQTSTIEVFGSVLDPGALVTIGVCFAALAAFTLLARYSKLGVAMRAAARDQEAALALGIPVGKLLAATWFIAGAFAALGGVALGVRDPSIDHNLGFIALRAFPAVIVGGLESALGAVVASLLLGLLEVYTAAYVNPALGAWGRNLHAVLPYLVMIAFLVVRPYGLFGQKKVERL